MREWNCAANLDGHWQAPGIRENMKALKGSSEERALIQRYVGQLDSQETRLATLHKEMADLTAQQAAEQEHLDRIIMDVKIEQTF